MTGKAEVLGENPVSLSLSQSQLSYEMRREGTRLSAGRSCLLTA